VFRSICAQLDGVVGGAFNLAVAGGVDCVTLVRWIVVAFVLCTFAGVGMLGWHFAQGRHTDRLCTSAAAHCGERPYASAP